MKKLLPIFLILVLAISCGKDDDNGSDACSDVACNYGTCVDGTCLCDAGYEGANCDVAINDRFIGTWELPCEGDINVSLAGNIAVPPFSSTIEIESNGNPSEIKLDFVIPLVNQSITLVGVVDGNDVNFEEQTIVIPESVVNSALSLAGVNLPISLGDIPITITGVGTYSELNEELLVDITIDGGILLNGLINCVGVKL